jgi:hypothetical protein
MKYFKTLPTIVADDGKGHKIAATNLLVDISVVTSLLNNPALYYKYDVKDSDTPEIIAEKYYGDVYRYWIVLFANQVIDPQWDWPLTSALFQKYLENKYSAHATQDLTAIQYTQKTLYEYRETITTLDSFSGIKTDNVTTIDKEAYDRFMPLNQTITFDDRTKVTITSRAEKLTIYDWENEQNEKKRNIRLINSTFANQFEAQLNILANKHV